MIPVTHTPQYGELHNVLDEHATAVAVVQESPAHYSEYGPVALAEEDSVGKLESYLAASLTGVAGLNLTNVPAGQSRRVSSSRDTSCPAAATRRRA